MSRNNTGNPIDSRAFPDFEDNVKNLDQAVNSDQDTFTDRRGRSRLTWAGIQKAGAGDTGVAVDAAARAVAAAGRAEEAEAIVDATNIKGLVTEAEAARDAAFVNADVYPTIAAGMAAVATGDQFQVPFGTEMVRYRKDSGSTQTEVARYPAAAAVKNAETLSLAGIFTASWVSGGYHASTGVPVARNDRVRLASGLIALDGNIEVTCNVAGQQCGIFIYDEDGTFLSYTSPLENYQRAAVRGYVGVVVGWEDGRPITPNDVNVTINAGNDTQYLKARNLLLTGEYPARWTLGSINPNTGEAYSRVNRVRMADEKVPLRGRLVVEAPPGQLATIFSYDREGNYLGYSANLSYHDVPIDGHFTVGALKDPEAHIAPDEVGVVIRAIPGTEASPMDPRLVLLATTGELAVVWEQGGINPNDGQQLPRTVRVRLRGGKLPLDGYLSINPNTPDQQLTIFAYDEHGGFLGMSDTVGAIENYPIKGYFDVTLRWVDGGAIIRPEDVQDAVVKISRTAGSGGAPVGDTWLNEIPRFSQVPFGYSINLPYAEKEALFEQLVADYPATLTKEKIGESYNGEHDVNVYTLTPDSYSVTVAITMHTHGNEKYNPAGFFALLHEISKPGPKHEFLQWLRTNVRWIMVPFVSPMGYILNTRSTNGVNINRNFDYRWVFNTVDNDKGSAPNSEPETQNIVNYFTPLKDEIDYHMDLHDIPGAGNASIAYMPFQNREFLWESQMENIKKALSKINQAPAGGKYIGEVGSQNNFFNGNLGIPSMVPEHVNYYWINLGLTPDQQVAKATEQTVAYMYMFKRLFVDRRWDGFYRRKFEVAFGSEQFGFSEWGVADIHNYFSILDGFSETSPGSGIFERPGNTDKTILVIAGITPDNNNSSLVAMRCAERVLDAQEMYISHLQTATLVFAPVLNPNADAESSLNARVQNLVNLVSPDYTVVVRADLLEAAAIPATVRAGSTLEVTPQTLEAGLSISETKIGIETVLPSPYTVFDLGNQVVGAGLYSHCVAEWVGYVLNDMASFYIS